MSDSQGPTRLPYAAANEFEGGGVTTVQSPEERAAQRLDDYNIFVLGHANKHWRAKSPPKGEQDFRFAILSATSVVVNADFYCDFQIEKFLPGGQVMDAETREIKPLRRRILKKSPGGEVVFPTCFMPAVKFLSEYEPEPEWMTASEFQNILDEMAAVIEHDRALLKTEKGFHQNENRRLSEAAAAHDNPTRTMAQGVAQALHELGLAPKSKAA